jgi:tetraacyldisaccharide 4'-kinase
VTFLESLLWPLTLPYGAVAHLRARAYRTGLLRQRRLDGIVISVGNLTTGGTGKTPMVLWIAQHLLAEEKPTGILTRGYGGHGDGANSTSDEVRLLRAHLGDRVAFGVGADRFVRGSELAKNGVKWFILDDGFQHLPLARDVDIVLVDAVNPFGNGYLLPAGRLREHRSALSRADVIVITRSDHAPALEAAIRHDSSVPIFYARPHLESIRLYRGDYPGTEAPECHARKLFAFSGIGNPAALRADLREWGFQVAGFKSFPDHHRYTPEDVRAIAAQARAAGADGAICTEKDVFNLSAVEWGDLDLCFCRISMHVAHEDAFWRTIKALTDSGSRSGK